MLKEKLEIVLITYNRKSFLENTLNQIFAPSSPIKDLDITILNNNSNDGTDELIESFVNRFSNLKHVKNVRNIGGNANIAKTFAIAKKQYLWTLCDDDDFNFDGFDEIEKAIDEGYDLIFTRKLKNDIADVFYTATFVPACIYKTDNLTSTVMMNVYDNCVNFFPHLAPVAKIINDEKKIYFPKKQYIEIGTKNNHPRTYVRTLEQNDIPEYRRNMFWTVAYLKSTYLITNSKKRYEIVDKLKHFYSSLFVLLINKIRMNKLYYNNSKENLFAMFNALFFKHKLMFILAFIIVEIQFLICNMDYYNCFEPNVWEKYLEKVNQKKYLNKLAKKYKNKEILIYGAGMLFDLVAKNYDLSKLNIVAISDRKFTEIGEYRGFKAIPPEKILELNPDAILFSVCQYQNIYRSLNIEKNNESLICRKRLIPLS